MIQFFSNYFQLLSKSENSDDFQIKHISMWIITANGIVIDSLYLADQNLKIQINDEILQLLNDGVDLN